MADAPRVPGRCRMCGYRLQGLPPQGTCPECGSIYNPATFLKPWPSALSIIGRLGWPLVGVVLGGAMLRAGTPPTVIAGSILLYAMLVVIPVNSYFRVRKLLRNSVPEHIRTRGPVAVFRAIGTILCVTLFLVFVGVPIVGIGMCLFQ